MKSNELLYSQLYAAKIGNTIVRVKLRNYDRQRWYRVALVDDDGNVTAEEHVISTTAIKSTWANYWARTPDGKKEVARKEFLVALEQQRKQEQGEKLQHLGQRLQALGVTPKIQQIYGHWRAPTDEDPNKTQSGYSHAITFFCDDPGFERLETILNQAIIDSLLGFVGDGSSREAYTPPEYTNDN